MSYDLNQDKKGSEALDTGPPEELQRCLKQFLPFMWQTYF